MNLGQARTLSAVEVLQAYRSSDLTVVQYVRALLGHIERQDAQVRAWTHVDGETALAHAAELDETALQERGPLHGICVAVKDVIDVQGMPTCYGSKFSKCNWPMLDASSVGLLRGAGAILLGKTTTTELAASCVGTATTNPHDRTHTPGGSSSGSAAAVADYQVTVALGTQTGGSIMRPASFTGIYGFKPRWHNVSTDGQRTYSKTLDTLGLFARSVEDLCLLSEVLGILSRVHQVPGKISKTRQGFAYLRTGVWDLAGPGTRQGMNDVVHALRESGKQLDKIVLPSSSLLQWQRTIMKREGSGSFRTNHRSADQFYDTSVVEMVDNPPTAAEYLTALDGVAALIPKWDWLASRDIAALAP